MNKTWVAAALLASAITLGACNGKGSGNASAPANAAAPANVAVPANVETPAPANAMGDSAPAAPTAPSGGNQNFKILNKTGHTIVAFNVSPNKEDQWGPDILGQDVLNDGESANITFARDEKECIWDLRATYDDEDTTEMTAVNLCEVATVTFHP